jgi:predicted DNA-binding ribbon-helix-helix protein
MKKFSVLIAGRHATSVSLEEEFYDDLLKIAAAQNVSCNKLITQIDSERTTDNLSSAIRLYVLQYYKNLATPK